MRDIIDERDRKESISKSIVKFWNVNYIAAPYEKEQDVTPSAEADADGNIFPIKKRTVQNAIRPHPDIAPAQRLDLALLQKTLVPVRVVDQIVISQSMIFTQSDLRHKYLHHCSYFTICRRKNFAYDSSSSECSSIRLFNASSFS